MPNTCQKCNQKTLDLLLSLPLFAGAEKGKLISSIEKGSFLCRTYRSGDVIYSPEEEEKRLIIFCLGEASVYSADESRSVLLRTVSAGKTVGVANLFSSERFVSRIIADKKCETVEITATDFKVLLESDSAILHNYISFLSNKICYLNKKIVYLTAGSAERRLAFFLDSHASEVGGDSFPLPVPMNSLAEMLNLGRASLYRAADKLEADGFIKRDGKNITLISKEQMLSKYI
jgi:CRP-like cAMP-binding protein